MSNFGRKIEITIGLSKYTGLYVDFEVNKSDDSSVDDAIIVVYNLNSTSRANIAKGDTIILSAGYGNNIGTIFLGEVFEASSKREESDWATKIICKDGIELSKLKVSKSYAPGVLSSTVLNDLLSLTGLEIGRFELAQEIVYSNGKVTTGLLVDNIRDMSKEAGSIYTIKNNKNLISLDQTTVILAEVISNETGLLETPTPLDDSTTDKSLYNVVSQLNPALDVGSSVQVISSSLNGTVKIRKVTFIGSLDGKHFMNELEVIVSE